MQKRHSLTESEFKKLESLRGKKLNVSKSKNGKYRCRVSASELKSIRTQSEHSLHEKQVNNSEDGKQLQKLLSDKDKENVTDMGDYFVIMMKNGEERKITKEKVLEIYEVYTRKNTTVDKACILLGITRTDFMIVKQAFHLTKSSYKYPDYCFGASEYDKETMTNYENLSRKVDFIQNVSRKKSLDQEKRLKRYDTVAYWYEKAIDSLISVSKRKDSYLHPVAHNIDPNKEHILVIADTHLGIRSDNPFNKYDVSIAVNRFEQISGWCIANRHKITGKLHILDLGDTISGYIHGSLKEQNEIPVTTQFKTYVETIEKLIVALSDITSVSYRICSGNHARVYESKQDDINEANWESLIPMFLKNRFSDFKNVNIVDQSKQMIVGSHEIKMFDYYIGAEHGNRVKYSNAAQDWNSMYQKFYKEVLMGHYHCRQSYSDNGTLVEVFPSISGVDEYAANIKKRSNPEATLLTYSSVGREKEEYIYLK